MTVEIFRIHDNNKLYFNVTERLISPGGTKFSKSIEETSKEELNFCVRFFLHVSEEERWHALQKFIDEVH